MSAGLQARRCRHCGALFRPVRRPEQVFCCPECRRRWHSWRESRGARAVALLIAWRGDRRRGSLTKLAAFADELVRTTAIVKLTGMRPGGRGADMRKTEREGFHLSAQMCSTHQRASYALRPDVWRCAMADNDGTEIAHLAALPVLDYEREREGAAERLRCRVLILDQLVEAARASGEANTPDGARRGRTLAIPDIEPWSVSVDGSVLLADLSTTILRYVVVDRAASDAVALWIVHTHTIDAAMVSPRLAITSPDKRCGKTRLLTLLRALVARPLATANMTAAVLFRVIEMEQPTLLIDEADTFISGADTMRGIINAGHSRATATVLRAAPDSRDGWEPRAFNVWGALALAAIGKLPGTIEDRSVRISLRRRRSDESIEALRIDRLDRLLPLARQAARWADDHYVVLSAAEPKVPPELHDRAADNWRSLLAIAEASGDEWAERARHAAIQLTREGADSDGTEASGVMVLSDLRELFAAEQTGVLFTAEILDALCSREDRPYSEHRRGRPMTAPQLAALIRPFEISTNQTVRRGSATAKGYRAKDFADIWDRYLPPYEAVTRSQASDSGASRDPGPVTGDDAAVTGEPAAVTPSGDVTETGPGVTGHVTEKG
jgi:Protein of unknown function (DUF3631)